MAEKVGSVQVEDSGSYAPQEGPASSHEWRRRAPQSACVGFRKRTCSWQVGMLLRGGLGLLRRRGGLCLCLWLAVDDSVVAPLAGMRTGRIHKMRLHVLPRCAGGCVVLQAFLCSGPFFDVSRFRLWAGVALFSGVPSAFGATVGVMKLSRLPVSRYVRRRGQDQAQRVHPASTSLRLFFKDLKRPWFDFVALCADLGRCAL